MEEISNQQKAIAFGMEVKDQNRWQHGVHEDLDYKTDSWSGDSVNVNHVVTSTLSYTLDKGIRMGGEM
jgi:hypothetical protein